MQWINEQKQQKNGKKIERIKDNIQFGAVLLRNGVVFLDCYFFCSPIFIHGLPIPVSHLFVWSIVIWHLHNIALRWMCIKCIVAGFFLKKKNALSVYALFIWTMPIAVDAVPPQYPVIFMRNYRDTISFIVITIAIAIVVVVIFGCVGWLSSTIRFDWVPLLQLPVLCLCVCFFCSGISMSDVHTTHCRATRAHDGMLWCSTILLCGVSNLYAYDKTLHYYYFLKSEQSISLDDETGFYFLLWFFPSFASIGIVLAFFYAHIIIIVNSVCSALYADNVWLLYAIFRFFSSFRPMCMYKIWIFGAFMSRKGKVRSIW